MKTVVVAQVGCGYWGPNLLRSFAAIPEARLKTLCDMRPGRLAWAKERFPELETTQSFDAVLADPEIDAVVVATEPVTHHKLGRRVLQAGKHLFVEKPLAQTARDAQDLARRAKAKKLSLGVGHVYLYHPGIRGLKAAMTPSLLGRVQYLDLARVNPGPPAPKHSVIWDLAPHEVSLAVDFAGTKPLAVKATGLRWTLSVLEAAFIEIRFSRNVFARVHASWRGHARVRRLDAYCENGAAYFDEMAPEKLRLVYPGADNRSTTSERDASTLTYGAPRVEVPALSTEQPLSAECADFIAAVRERRDPQSGPALGVAVARILEAAEKSARSGGREVAL